MDLKKMIINNFRIVEVDDLVNVSVMVESSHYGSEELWFSVPKEYRNYICENQLDGFLVGMLYPAMRYGEDIYIDGCISEKLLFNLNNYAIPLLSDFSDSLRKIRISSKLTTDRNYNGVGVGTGFSAGVDSFCTFYDRCVLEDSPSHKINSLLFLNVGSNGDWFHYGSTEFTKNKFMTRHLELKQFADEVGFNLIKIDSNLHFFHQWWHSCSHSLKAASAVLLFQQYYSKYYYSSAGLSYAGTLTYSRYYKNRDVGAYCDPILLPLLSTETLDFISDGCAYTRSEKLLHILNYEPVVRYLNVCVDHLDNWENCSVCDKCLRTLLVLDFTGNLGRVEKIFDINRYMTKKKDYVASQVEKAGSDPFSSDIIALARSLNIELPSLGYVRFLRRIRRVANFPILVLRKIVRLVVSGFR